MRPFLPLFLMACAPTAPDGADDTDPICPEAPGVVETVATGFDGGTEGLVFDGDGRLWVSGDDAVHTVAADGTTARIAEVPGVLGLAWFEGRIWATSRGDDGPALIAVDATGSAERFALTEPGMPNFLIPTPWGTLLLADDFDDRLFEITADGTATIWLDGETPSPNGMAFSADGGTLFVANTFELDPPLQAITVAADGTPGATTTAHAFETGTTPDGVAIADDDAVLVALNLVGRLDWVQDGAATTLVEDLNTPASLAFGRGDFDPCSVYVTSLVAPDIVRVSTGTTGR